MSGSITCDVYPRLDAIAADAWARLFPDSLDSPEMIQLIQRCGIDGFTFHSIVVRQDGRPILVLPLFETVYDLATFVNPRWRPIIQRLSAWLPGLCRPRVLGTGFIEAEWGQAGVEPSLTLEELEVAWEMALKVLEVLAAGLHAEIIAFVNFTPESGRMLPMHKLHGVAMMAGLPYGRVPIACDSLEDYIAGLSSNTRSSLRRKLRTGREIDIVRTRRPGPWLATIYQQYVSTVQRSEVVFGVHRREFFEQICDRVPGAEYWLYFLHGELLAFRLVIVTPDCLIDKYFGMDAQRGRAHNLYFVSWLENIRYCIQHRIPYYHAGQAEEDTKARLGARLIPSRILFRHRRPLWHHAFAWLAKRFAYQPKVTLPDAQLGRDWNKPQPNGHGIASTTSPGGDEVMSESVQSG